MSGLGVSGVRGQDTFFEFRVFYPFASSYLSSSLPALYRRHSKARKREYRKRGLIELIVAVLHRWLLPLLAGGMCAEMQIAMN